MKSGLLKNDWEKTQIKVFSRWVNKYLKQRGLSIESVTTDLSDGTKLINLLEILGKEDIGKRWHKEPKLRVHKLENCTFALDYITNKKGIKLVSISSDNIVDNNPTLTLGLIYSLILKFQVEDISVEEATARDALLIWCKKNTKDYEGVNITNFTNSWANGLGFCALIDHFRPDVLDFKSLDPNDHMGNSKKAFDACQELGITVFLDPEDIVDVTPDEKSVVTQCAEFFHYFSAQSKNEEMADKLRKTITIQREIQELFSSYESDARAALSLMSEVLSKQNSDDYEKDVPGIKGKLSQVIAYGSADRPPIMELRGKALKSWNQLTTKCRSNKRPLPQPPAGLEPEALTSKLEELDANSSTRRDSITDELRDLEKRLINDFDEKCNGISTRVQDLLNTADNVSGSFDEQNQVLNDCKSGLEEANGGTGEIKEKYEQLSSYKLNNRTRHTYDNVVAEIEQALAHLTLLFEQLANETKIDAYNQKAQAKVNEVKQIESDVSAITGERAERKEQLLQKQIELDEKRPTEELDEEYNKLQEEKLHFNIEYTPEAIKSLFNSLFNRISTLISDIDKMDTNDLHKKLINEFDEKCEQISQKVNELVKQADTAEGEFAHQQEVLTASKNGLEELANNTEEIKKGYEELVQLKINQRARHTAGNVEDEIKQAQVHVDLLSKQLEDEIKIDSYNQKAQAKVNESKEIEAAIGAITGEREERRTKLNEQQAIINEKNQLEEIEGEYKQLEEEKLHYSVEYTPSAIKGMFDALLARVSTQLSEIEKADTSDLHKKLIKEFDEKCKEISQKVQDLVKAADDVEGSIQEQNDVLTSSKSGLESIASSTDDIKQSYDELIQLKLNNRTRHTVGTVEAEIQQGLAHIDLLFEQLSVDTKIDSYNQKAQAKVNEAKEIEASLGGIEGSHEERREKLLEKQREIEERKDIGDLNSEYSELEREELHFGIEYTPASITGVYDQLLSHVSTLLSEIDKAVADEKGLQIPPEQIQEYRQTFLTFDKTGDRLLQYYELKACLTALGENFSDDECKEVIKKYSNTANKEDLDFDGYVKFMEDHFSKAETASSTKEAFGALCQKQGFITDSQIDMYFRGDDAQFLKDNLPKVEGGYDFSSWADNLYLQD